MPFRTANDAQNDIREVQNDLSQGHVSVQEASDAVTHINEAYDNFADNLNRQGVDLERIAITIFNQNTFDAFGGIKNGAATGMESVTSFFNAVDSFKGSWRDPEQARRKIEEGITMISNGVNALGNTLNNISRAGSAIGSAISSKFGSSHPMVAGFGSKLSSGSTVLGTAGATLIAGATTFNASGITQLAGTITQNISRGVNSGRSNLLRTSPNTNTSSAESSARGEVQSLTGNSATDGVPTGGASPLLETDVNNIDIEENKSQGSTSQVDGGVEFVSEINFVLDGTPGEANSECTIDGVSYLISNYQLSQSMLSPMTLTFTLVKKAVAEESEKDVKYNVCKEIIGLDVDLTVKTKSSETNADASTFKFKGLITGVSASRGMGGTPSIFVTASSYDYILNAAPNCRSFENKTLEEIVTTVTSSCTKLECNINPRLKTPIPYIVQYNQTDYEFLTSLARRFGEWMYHDGTKFIFGEIVQPSEAVVKMRYPGGSIFGHGVDLQLRDLNIMHVSPDLYNYGENGIKSQTDDGMADRNMHELNEAVWNRVKSLYTQQDIYYPHIGGAFDDGQSEGSIELIENSIKVESRGKKAQMFTSNGASKVAKLFLGQQFEIEDGIEKTSSIDKQDLLQHPLMVLSVSHTFNSDQTYDNTFEAIPITCDYPPYGNADIFATAFPQRATIIDNQDPQGLGRVRVQFPWQKVQSNDDSQMITPWIRVSQPYGGFSKGTQFISEVGEEVMIGFEMDNIERPYVLGALFNGTGNPDPEWKAQVAEGTANNIKAIRTRNGHTIQFNDEGDGGDIQIYDYEKNNYLIHLSSDGKYIRIEAKGDIQISAGNNIGIKAGKNISIEAGENISIDSGKDTDINADANMSISAENNMQQEATDIFVKAKDAISQESENSHIIKTTTLQEKSSGKTSIDGGGLVEITASSVKVR